ncbi:ATPase synthesis protein 25 mitochondrial [Acarospora aff. strigata]|nr:ATPase synthesis protein 25 mitochondrial [Acarospora aff. strigata]
MIIKAVSLTSRCGSCRLALLKSFTSLAGVPFDLQPLTTAARLGRYPTGHLGESRATFSALIRRASDQVPETDSHGVVDNEVNILDDGVETEDSPASHHAPIPWYLQVETPKAPVYPISDRQRLPNMPVDPPPLLEPLLKYVSVDLGMDDLSLFDLRELDPPPALGANLLMVLGTARSERHLHVSADRLCRWLRSTYRLTPFPDGLLGRNELKLKMRRKARRAKLLGNIGTSASSNPDDGVRTGWVCVNVGTVQSVKVAQHDVADTPGIVGFGSGSGGVKIVVQMLTEEKRGELDLEELWGGMLRRQAKRSSEIVEIGHEQRGGEEVGSSTHFRTGMASDMSRFVPFSHPRSMASGQLQARALHTSRTISEEEAAGDEKLLDYPGLDSASVEPILKPWADLETPSHDVKLPSTDGVNNGLGSAKLQGTSPPRLHPRLLRQRLNTLPLQALLKYLKSLPRDAALRALGQNSKDSSSTIFLASFYHHLAKTSGTFHCCTELELFCYAVELGHHGYPKSSLAQLLAHMRRSGLSVAQNILLSVLRATLLRREFSTALDKAASDSAGLSSADITMSVELLEELRHRGCRTLPEEIGILLQEATGVVMPLRRITKHTRLKPHATLLAHNPTTPRARLLRLLPAFSTTYNSEPFHLHTLHLLATRADWSQFWVYWHDIAKRALPRSAALYACLFRAMAQTGHQVNCMQTIREWVPEMHRERTPVRIEGNVAVAVRECLLVAHPEVEEEARENPGAGGEWVPLWVESARALDG